MILLYSIACTLNLGYITRYSTITPLLYYCYKTFISLLYQCYITAQICIHTLKQDLYHC